MKQYGLTERASNHAEDNNALQKTQITCGRQ